MDLEDCGSCSSVCVRSGVVGWHRARVICRLGRDLRAAVPYAGICSLRPHLEFWEGLHATSAAPAPSLGIAFRDG